MFHIIQSNVVLAVHRTGNGILVINQTTASNLFVILLNFISLFYILIF